jgi:hypothetical protein
MEKDKMGGICSTHGDYMYSYKSLVGNVKGRIHLGCTGHIWENNRPIKAIVKEIGCRLNSNDTGYFPMAACCKQ